MTGSSVFWAQYGPVLLLAVGILALVGHNWLIGHIEGLTHQLRKASMDLLRLVSVGTEEQVDV